MRMTKIIAVYAENHANSEVQNAELLIFNVDGAYSTGVECLY
jgi:hypothetical protein